MAAVIKEYISKYQKYVPKLFDVVFKIKFDKVTNTFGVAYPMRMWEVGKESYDENQNCTELERMIDERVKEYIVKESVVEKVILVLCKSTDTSLSIKISVSDKTTSSNGEKTQVIYDNHRDTKIPGIFIVEARSIAYEKDCVQMPYSEDLEDWFADFCNRFSKFTEALGHILNDKETLESTIQSGGFLLPKGEKDDGKK